MIYPEETAPAGRGLPTPEAVTDEGFASAVLADDPHTDALLVDTVGTSAERRPSRSAGIGTATSPTKGS